MKSDLTEKEMLVYEQLSFLAEDAWAIRVTAWQIPRRLARRTGVEMTTSGVAAVLGNLCKKGYITKVETSVGLTNYYSLAEEGNG